ncbi:GTP-binding protein, partial [Lishizhenia sp.]|uniref:GTP-binding protein n=1 Tax=Lishizhenia sp. TaxID=2497594 RepID=UPI00299D42A7
IPGTTRDTIEEMINIEGVSFRLIDTAGIREASDEIERIGIERTHQKIESSNTVVYLFDALNTPVEEVNKDIALLPAAKHLLVVATKNDKIDDATREHILQNIVKREGVELHFIYGKDENDLEKVKKAIYDISIGDSFEEHSTIVTNARHYDNLIKASSDLEKAKEGLETGITGDFVAMDIRQALYHLGQITGEISTDDLLGNIFANFCIGK